jgi:isopentenyl-diphosphate delta-isomerase
MSATITETRTTAITAENILRLFPDIDTSGEALEGHDEEQIRLMDEVCIVTDENDMPIGTASKKLCKLCPCPAFLGDASQMIAFRADRGGTP